MTDIEVKQRILALLMEGEKTVDEINKITWIAKRNIEHALRELRKEGKIAHYDGKYHIVTDVIILLIVPCRTSFRFINLF